MDNICSWCQAAQWQYRCFTCDPRKEKVLCPKCSVLWHSRGFARSHHLTSRYGETRSFNAWIPPQQNGVSNSNGSTETEAQGPDSNGLSDVVDDIQVQHVAINGTEDTTPGSSEKQEKMDQEDTNAAKETDNGVEESKREDEKEEGEVIEVEFEAVDESVDTGDTTSVEIELKEKKNASAKESLASANSVSGMNAPVGSSGRKIEGQFELNDREEHKDNSSVPIASAAQGISSSPLSTPAAATNLSVQDQDASSALVENSTAPASSPASASETATPDTAIASNPHEPAREFIPAADTPAERAFSRSVAQPIPVNLEKLLRWFPTTDQILIDMLATRVEKALVIEDALICARIGKCQESWCRSVLLHYEHCKHDEPCGDPMCVDISIVYGHRRACSKKDVARKNDGNEFVCPFCIRIRQRRSLGIVAALDHLISDQRRALQGAHSEANRNFCLQSINTWSQRKQVLYAEIDRLNRLARESSSLVYNFPRYQWHFGDAVFIKREPTHFESENKTTELSAPESSMNGTNGSTATEQPSLTRSGDEHNFASDTLQSENIPEDSTTGNANFDADFINELLWAKSEDGDGREVSQREFDGVMELGYAIVDASFCAPSKAQRCLLNCKSILIHLQHHLDLQVCTQAMCTAVEHHFSHLSQCKARNDSESCEYCLRVEERQLIRSVDFMEAEQPEAEAKVQKIINDITASFTNHRPDEREQEVIQLEDELEQAEANKQELLEKLGAARMNLRKVRRSMERHGVSTFINRQLPVHFVNVRRADGSGSSFKKRRVTGSPD